MKKVLILLLMFFAFYWQSSSQSTTVQYVNEFNWVEAHGARNSSSYYYDSDGSGWLTSAKNQFGGTCIAYARIGLLESLVNLWFNDSEINYDISEQYLIDCYTPAGTSPMKLIPEASRPKRVKGYNFYKPWIWNDDLCGGDYVRILDYDSEVAGYATMYQDVLTSGNTYDLFISCYPVEGGIEYSFGGTTWYQYSPPPAHASYYWQDTRTADGSNFYIRSIDHETDVKIYSVYLYEEDDATSLVDNGDFSNGMTDWVYTAGQEGDTLYVSGGELVVDVHKNMIQPHPWISQAVDVDTSTAYFLTFELSSAEDFCGIAYEFKNGSGWNVGDENGWDNGQDIRRMLTTGNDPNDYDSLRFTFYGEFTLDNIRLYEVNNVAENGNFIDVTNDQPDDWTIINESYPDRSIEMDEYPTPSDTITFTRSNISNLDSKEFLPQYGPNFTVSGDHALVTFGHGTIQAGNYIMFGSASCGMSQPVEITSSSEYIGDRYYLLKNSWGDDHYVTPTKGSKGFVKLYADDLFLDYGNKTYSIESDVYSQVSTINDKDGDGIGWWGLGPRPSVGSETNDKFPDYRDYNDFNANVGKLNDQTFVIMGNIPYYTEEPGEDECWQYLYKSGKDYRYDDISYFYMDDDDKDDQSWATTWLYIDWDNIRIDGNAVLRFDYKFGVTSANGDADVWLIDLSDSSKYHIYDFPNNTNDFTEYEIDISSELSTNSVDAEDAVIMFTLDGENNNFLHLDNVYAGPGATEGTLSYVEDFESALGDEWMIVEMPNRDGGYTGRSNAPSSPYEGSYVLRMHDGNANSTYTLNEAWLMVDLSDYSSSDDLTLYFYGRDSGDENHTDIDGVDVSSNGVDWVTVQTLYGGSYTNGSWYSFSVDLDSEIDGSSDLSYSEPFFIRFTQYDNASINNSTPTGSDGWSIDKVMICEDLSNITNMYGSTLVCAGEDDVNYYVTPVPTAVDTYTWTYSGTGATLTPDEDECDVDFSSSATSGYLRCTISNDCGESDYVEDYITVDATGPSTPSIGGEDCIDRYDTEYYEADASGADNFEWRAPDGGLTLEPSGPDNSMCDVTMTAFPGGSVRLQVKAYDACDNASGWATKWIDTNCRPIPSITDYEIPTEPIDVDLK